MKVIITGCGRVGALLAKLLDGQGHQVTVIDRDAASLRQLDSSFGGTPITGDAADEEVLKKAGIEEIQVLVAVTQTDNRNIMIAQIAQHTFRVPRVVCRINDPQLREIYADLGLEIISPADIMTQLLRDMVVG